MIIVVVVGTVQASSVDRHYRDGERKQGNVELHLCAGTSTELPVNVSVPAF